jgi:thioredoxin-like negative regulator of GroEL
LRAYEQLAKIPEHAVGAYLATERLSAMNADTAVQRDAAEKIASLSPNDLNAADQLAYLNLLVNRDVTGSFEKAKAIALKDPTRLSYRVTAALGYLRTNDPGPALAQFQPPAGAPAIEWENTPAGWRAVYAATLIANEKTQEAEEILKNIPRDRLIPEEKRLIEAKK